MRFLICLRSTKAVRNTLQFGALMASRLGSNISILYIDPEVRHSMNQEFDMVRQKMSEWQMEPVGNEVLAYARDHLASMGLIKETIEDHRVKQVLSPAGSPTLELPGAHSGIKTVSFRYRQGNVIEEILSEMHSEHHEILVIGGGGDKDFLTNILKFSPSSVLVVKNPLDIKYKILVVTDASPPAHRAELLGIKTASFLNLELVFLTVAKDKSGREFMKIHLDRMSRVCEMKRVPYEVIIEEGDLEKITARVAGDDHIIFLGRSRRGALKKLLFGSKTINIAVEANCPLFIVK